MILTHDEILTILGALKKAYEIGSGYSDVPEIAKLQAKLSIMLEAAANTLMSEQFDPKDVLWSIMEILREEQGVAHINDVVVKPPEWERIKEYHDRRFEELTGKALFN